ncbi:MAG: geranylgeranyl reductase family protein [Anaerolineales bacterium]|nr:geranylgeranyl reductase family protein [Anaerolineales bacterium]
MVILNSHRCTYCGGCVSVCPVEALTLHETRLVVLEECIDCGDCVASCPVGALQMETTQQPSEQREPHRKYDAVVVGAGPGGSTAARTMAEAGLSVLLLEKRQEIGSPVRCAEGIGQEQLTSFIEPDPSWIAAEVDKAEITSVKGDERNTIQGSGGSGYILERRIFDRVLAEMATDAGVHVMVKTPATALLMEEGRIRGVRIRDCFSQGNAEIDIEARLIIAADGIEAQVGRWAGLDLQLPLEDTMVCAQFLLANIDIDPTCTYYEINHDIAPGGYAWVFPKGDGKANVGLGVQADLWEEFADQNPECRRIGHGTVLGFLTRYIESNPRLERGNPVTLITGNVPVNPLSSNILADGLLIVGDAARQVDPLTGGGIYTAMTAGQLAGQVAAGALSANDTSARFLKKYQEGWDQSEGRKLKRNARLRHKFPPEARSDSRFLHAFATAVGG